MVMHLRSPGYKRHVSVKIGQGATIQVVIKGCLCALVSPHHLRRFEYISNIWNVLAVAAPLCLVGRLHPTLHGCRLRSGKCRQEPHVVFFLSIHSNNHIYVISMMQTAKRKKD